MQALIEKANRKAMDLYHAGYADTRKWRALAKEGNTLAVKWLKASDAVAEAYERMGR